LTSGLQNAQLIRTKRFMADQSYSFDWGELIRVAGNAPVEFRPGAVASICGIRSIKNELEAVAAGHPIRTVICLIEFGDGSSVEIAESYLEKVKSNTQ
jgi:hypothetical protein